MNWWVFLFSWEDASDTSVCAWQSFHSVVCVWREAFDDAKAGEFLFTNHAGEGLILASGFLSHSYISQPTCVKALWSPRQMEWMGLCFREAKAFDGNRLTIVIVSLETFRANNRVHCTKRVCYVHKIPWKSLLPKQIVHQSCICTFAMYKTCRFFNLISFKNVRPNGS